MRHAHRQGRRRGRAAHGGSGVSAAAAGRAWQGTAGRLQGDDLVLKGSREGWWGTSGGGRAGCSEAALTRLGEGRRSDAIDSAGACIVAAELLAGKRSG